MIESGSIAIVGAAESTNIGVVPNVSSTGLAIDAAANALADAGLRVLHAGIFLLPICRAS